MPGHNSQLIIRNMESMVQYACDYKCMFVYAALAAPGGANDIAAWRKIKSYGRRL